MLCPRRPCAQHRDYTTDSYRLHAETPETIFEVPDDGRGWACTSPHHRGHSHYGARVVYADGAGFHGWCQACWDHTIIRMPELW
jgi:hypothetical protein